jgi:outer membrane lipoprotein-sorting protein
MKKILIIFLIFTLFTPLLSQEPTGREIMSKVVLKTGWQDMEAEITMTITLRSRTRTRKIKMYSRKRTEAESDIVMKFLYPPDVAGTGFLLIEHEKREDERYLYLPALRRIRRIAASGKGGAFMGSDFSYYDIGKPKLNDWQYKNLGIKEIDGQQCYQVEATPISPQIEKDTGYSRIIHWVDPEKWNVIRAEYYDRRGKLWKILEAKEIQEISGVWFQTHLLMKNVQSEGQSEMKFEKIAINKGLPAHLFTQRFLSR